jgi:hypothetical protein
MKTSAQSSGRYAPKINQLPNVDKMATTRSCDLQSLIGLEAVLAYQSLLLSHAQIQGATLFRYDAPPSMQDRIEITHAESTLIERANSMRKGTGIPFWEAIFATCAVEGHCTEPILAATFFHNGQGSPQYVSRREIEDGILAKIATGTTRTVALGSRVVDALGTSGHVSFLDFHCDVSAGNRAVVHEVCRKVMPRGFLIFDSGGSYHACTTTVISDGERVRMLAMALLASPIVDARYVAHQLLQDSSSIRISHGGKSGKVPTVIDAWAP